IDSLREEQKRMGELLTVERQALIYERDATARKLEQALQSLGEDRVVLLQRKADAEARLEETERARKEELEAAEAAHRKELDALAQERDAMAAESYNLMAELMPL